MFQKFVCFLSFLYLCKKYTPMQKTELKENVILVDANHVDHVASHLRSTFQQMLGRDIPAVDLATWLVCCALDGGVPEGKNEVQCVLLHSKEKQQLEQFVPAGLQSEIDGNAFMDPALGEFLMSVVPQEELSGDNLFVQCAQVVLDASEVKRVVLVPNESTVDELGKTLSEIPQGKQVTLLTMQPRDARGYQENMLGFSLMHAMGIKSEEL